MASRISLLTVAVLAAASGGAVVTFDFAAASGRMFQKGGAADAGANLLDGVKWSPGSRLSTYAVAKDDSRRAALRKLVRHSCEDGVWRAETPEAAVDVCGDEVLARCLVADWSAYVKLPDAKGGRYRFSFLYAMGHTLGTIGQAYILYRKDRKNVGQTSEGLHNIDADNFQHVQEFVVPEGADEIVVILRVDGIGWLRFWNPVLMQAPPEKPVVLQLGAQGFFDGRFEISDGQPGLLSWLWKRGYGATWKQSDFGCELTVPKGFRLVGSSICDVEKAKGRALPDGSTAYRLPCAWWLMPKDKFSSWHRVGMMIVPEGKPGTRGRLTFKAVQKDGTVLSDVSETELVVSQRISAPMPKRFVGGICPSGIDWICGEKAEALYATFLADTGTAGVLMHTGADERHIKALRDAGLRELLRGDAGLANGFCIGPAKGRPEGDKYVFLKPGHLFAGRSACPISIYEESEFFRTVTVPWLKKRTEGLDGFWANWEPYYFAGQGCMCEKCRAAFAKYVGVSDAEMAKDWPKELARGGKWWNKIQRFRSIEHGKLVKTIAKHIDFIPGICWCEMSSAWRPRNLAAEVQAIDYAGSLKTICPWGPYVCWNTQTPYAPSEAPCLVTFCAAKDVRATVDADYPAGARPRIMAFPSGCSYGTDWVAQPEWIEIEQLSYFFNRWAASYPAGFPRGYDARYWRAFARANAMAATYEDFVYDGVRVDAAVTIRPAPGEKPFARKRNVSTYLDWTREGVPVVQHVAYRLDRRAIVAVFNFSQTADVRVDVVVKGKVRSAGVAVPACSCRVVELGGKAGAPARPAAARARDLSRVRIDAPDAAADEWKARAVEELKTHLAAKAGSQVVPDAPFRFVFGKPADAPPPRPFESRYRLDGDTVWLWGDDGGPDEIWDWGDDRGRETLRHKGSLFAVSLFAEEQLGMKWVWPLDDGVVVKPDSRPVLPAFAEGSFVTEMAKGRIRNYEAYTPYTRKQVESLMPPGLYEDEAAYPVGYGDRWRWQWRMRLQDREFFTYGHAFTDWWDRFHETHPEFLNYHVADGTRGWTGSAAKRSIKLCVSNPAVADQAVADWMAAGTNRYFNVCENDGTCWCECDACRALDVPATTPEQLAANKAPLADRYVTFWNRVAERAVKVRPDVQLTAYVYSAYRFPPKKARIEHPDNMVCGFVCNETDDGAGMVRAWQQAGMKKFFFRPNHLHFIGTIHRGLERYFYRQFRELLSLGMIGCDYDANVNRAVTAFEFYTLARVIADPTLDFERIAADYYSAYGAAAPEVRRYYEAVRETGEAARDRAQRERLESPEFFAEARKALPRTQEFGRSEEELLAKKAILDEAVARHAAAGDLSAVEARRLANLALQAEHGVLTYRFLVSVEDMPVAEMKARAKALNDFRVRHKADLPDLYTKVYRIWWGEIRYWKIYFRRCSEAAKLEKAGL